LLAILQIEARHIRPTVGRGPGFGVQGIASARWITWRVQIPACPILSKIGGQASWRLSATQDDEWLTFKPFLDTLSSHF
jgi:hypothetical protein